MNSRWTSILAMVAVGALLLLSVWTIDNVAAQGSDQTGDWPWYLDSNHGFGVRYPPGWIVQQTFENARHEAHLIRRRVSFLDASQAQIVLDVWDKDPSLSIDAWLQNTEIITTAGDYNALIGGQQALVLSTEGGCGVPVGVSTYVELGNRVVKFYVEITGVDSLPIYERILSSFTLLGTAVLDKGQTMLPDLSPLAPTTCGTNICPSTCWGECTFAARTEGCCGYHAVPRWQCSKECIGSVPGEFLGNCVWWGAYTRRDVGALATGNAENWAVSVRNTGQLPVDRTPKVGDIVVHPGSSYNHVAYVVWVSSDRAQYGMSDMGWCADCGPSPEEIKLRTVDDNDEFIHCAGNPVIPTTDWQFTNCPFGWTPSKGFSATELTGSSWSLNPAEAGFLLSPVLSLPASDHDGIEVRMASSAADTSGKIYFTTATSPSFDEAKSVSFTVVSDGTLHDYLITMRINPLWAGTITRVRLVPVGAGNTDGSVDSIEIARIRFVERIGDSVPPDQVTNVRPDGWAGPFTSDTSPTFQWDPASDDPGGSGLAGYYVAVDDWTPDGMLENDWWAGNVTTFTLPAIQPHGSHTVAVTSKDQEDNTNPTNTNLPGDAPFYRYYIDLRPPAAPVISISGQNCSGLLNNVWQNTCTTPSFSWTALDDGAGVRDYLTFWGAWPGGAPGSLTTATTFTPDPVTAADSFGSAYLAVVAADHMGQASAQSTFAIRYDGAVPSLQVALNGEATGTHEVSTWLDLSAIDEGSGVAALRVSRNGTDWDGWQPYRDALPWTLLPLDRQQHTAYVQVSDKAGNLSQIVSDTIYLDLVPLMPHSSTYRICADTLDAGGSASSISTHYSLISALGITWSAGEGLTAGASKVETSGFLSEISACLPITHSVAAPTGLGLDLTGSSWGQASNTPTTLGAASLPQVVPYFAIEAAPPDAFGITINSGDRYTNDPWVTVQNWAPQVALRRLSNSSDFVNEGWIPYAITATWKLPVGAPSVEPRFLYAWFRDNENQLFGPYADEIIYDPVPPSGFVAIPDTGIAGPTLLVEATDDNSGVELMRIGRDPALNGADWQPYTTTIDWSDAAPVAYVQFQDRAGNLSEVFSSRAAQAVHVPIVLRYR